MVVAQLVEQSLPIPEICRSNPNICKALSTYCSLNRKDKKRKRGRERPNFKKDWSWKISQRTKWRIIGSPWKQNFAEADKASRKAKAVWATSLKNALPFILIIIQIFRCHEEASFSLVLWQGFVSSAAVLGVGRHSTEVEFELLSQQSRVLEWLLAKLSPAK